jgi:hypothetical protein
MVNGDVTALADRCVHCLASTSCRKDKELPVIVWTSISGWARSCRSTFVWKPEHNAF